MKRSTLITASIVLTLAGCSASQASAIEVKPEVKVVSATATTLKSKSPITDFMKQAIVNSLKSQQKGVLKQLKKYTTRQHRTWYAFSGSTPRGWDCSGLVLWTYQQLGIDLPHRASLQAEMGKRTYHPQPGDIVAFYYKGSKYAYHVGIYMGKGKMIHAPAPGQGTRIEGVKHFGQSWSKIKYVRILDN